jgi:hypothetical protein
MGNELGKIYWNGTQGRKYEYQIFHIRTIFKADQLGNYIFAKQVLGGWEAVYIGEGDLKTRTEDHKINNDVIKKGATHIHVHIANNKTESFAEETDLLLVHTEAYHPTGCNIKKGG